MFSKHSHIATAHLTANSRGALSRGLRAAGMVVAPSRPDRRSALASRAGIPG